MGNKNVTRGEWASEREKEMEKEKEKEKGEAYRQLRRD